MNSIWGENIDTFIELCNKHSVKMLMVGGGAVNFHGYQRHSADVDFWLDMREDNLKRLLMVLQEMKFELTELPEKVMQQQQNISIKFSPDELQIELITNFSINKNFDEAFEQSEAVEIKKQKLLKWNVLSWDDLITSKIKASRPKDLLDIQELKRLKTKNNE